MEDRYRCLKCLLWVVWEDWENSGNRLVKDMMSKWCYARKWPSLLNVVFIKNAVVKYYRIQCKAHCRRGE